MMAKKYEKHPFDKGKYQSTVSNYGHGKGNGKSRQAVSKHYDKFTAENEPSIEAPSEPENEPVVGTDQIEDFDVKMQSEEFNPSEPEWLRVERDEEGGDPEVGSIPLPVRGVLKGLQGAVNASEFTVTEMREFFKHQARMVRFFLSGVVDPLVSWWGKGVTSDPTYAIKRTSEEWKMTEEITAQWMEYRGVSVPLNPDILMVGCIGALYAPPIAEIRKNADPTRPKRGPLAIFQRWRQRRTLRRALNENPHNDAEATYGLEP